jgi:molecular chaperone GrpE
VVNFAIVKSDGEEKGFTVVDRRISFDGDDNGEDVQEAVETKPTYVEELESRLESQQARVAEIKAQYKAALEEFENAKARSNRDAALEIRKGRKIVLTEMLEVLDNLDRAIEAAEGGHEGLLEGVSMVRDQFLSKLEHLGARRMDSMGKTFDPERHQAVSTVPVDDSDQDGKIVGIVTEGYMLDDDLLRPAMVAVGKHGPVR